LSLEESEEFKFALRRKSGKEERKVLLLGHLLRIKVPDIY
jgi:hypothetical protein